jgi:site-specific DNA-methyltransferase (cytosine-N4-specific)
MAIELSSAVGTGLPAWFASIEDACRVLAEARTVAEVRGIRDTAEAARLYARLARRGREAQNSAAEIRVRAERRAAELAMQLVAGPGRPEKTPTVGVFSRIEEIGLSSQEFSRWRPLVQLPLPELERHFAEVRERGDDISTRAALRAALDYQRTVAGGRMVADVLAPLPAEHQVIEGDCREILPTLPSGSVQCVVTSVPYWRQRDYGHLSQIGLEPTPQEWAATLASVFHEVRRVVDERGVLWLNVGDKFQSSGYGWQVLGDRRDWQARTVLGLSRPTPGYKPRDLTFVPGLLLQALVADGWYLRQVVIWNKGMATEPKRPKRPSTSHEYVLLFTANEESRLDDPGEDWWSESVWHIPVEPTDEHPATMPRELARRCIVSSTSTGDVVADPFAGICTTASVASEIGRSSLSIELVPEFAARGRAHLSEGVA